MEEGYEGDGTAHLATPEGGANVKEMTSHLDPPFQSAVDLNLFRVVDFGRRRQCHDPSAWYTNRPSTLSRRIEAPAAARERSGSRLTGTTIFRHDWWCGWTTFTLVRYRPSLGP
jgi:hypothetical protein